VEPVATGDEVAVEHLLGFVVAETDPRLLAIETFDSDRLRLEQDVVADREAGVDEILHHLVLPVDRHHLAGELGEGNAVAPAVETERETVMNQSLAVKAGGKAELVHQVDGTLLEQTGAHPLDDILPAAVFQHDGFDPVTPQQMREQQAGRARTDDTNLRTHVSLNAPATPPPWAWWAAWSSTSAATACRRTPRPIAPWHG
jgi:hypothetical protein